MKFKKILSGILLAACAAWSPTALRAEATNLVDWPSDIAANTTWYNTNVYLLHGLVHVLAPATLTIQPGTVIKGVSQGAITNGDQTSALFITAGAKIHAVGTPTQPIIFTSEFDDTDDLTDLGIYERGLWGGLIVMGNAVLNTSSSGAGNIASPKYDVFEGLPDNQISGQFVYRFGGNNDTDNSGEIQYVSIRHGGYVIAGNKELNGLSMCAVGSGTTIDHVEAYAIADDGFEWFGGTVNTKYLVSAFNDDDAFDTDQGYRGKNQFWFAIQENGKRDSGGEWNGEPNGIAVSNAPIANFKVYNATWIGAGSGAATNTNHGLNIREYSAPRVFNSILTDFNPTGGSIGIKMDAKSGGLLTAGLLTVQQTIVNGFTTVSDAFSGPLFSNAALSNVTVNPLLVSISRTTNHLLDPRLQPASPALTTSITPPNDGFYTPVSFKGAFDTQTLWIRSWTALDAYGFLPNLPAAPTLTIVPSGANILVTYPSETGFSYQLKSVTNVTSTNWINEGSALTGTGGMLTNTLPAAAAEKYFRVLAQ